MYILCDFYIHKIHNNKMKYGMIRKINSISYTQSKRICIYIHLNESTFTFEGNWKEWSFF